MKKIVNLFLMFWFCFLNGYASEISEAEAAYNSGNFSKAVDLYKEVIESDSVSPALYYDMGNACYKAGNLGEAILFYERAKKLDPRNKFIINNLNFVTAKVVDSNKAEAGEKKNQLEYDSPTFLQSINKMIAEDHTSNSWAVFAVVAFLLFLLFAAMYFFTPNVLARKTGFFSGLIFLGFTVIFVIFAFMAGSYAQGKEDAVLIENRIALRENPDADSKSISIPLRDGTKFKILETSEKMGGTKWYKVRLNSHNIGWIDASDVEII